MSREFVGNHWRVQGCPGGTPLATDQTAKVAFGLNLRISRQGVVVLERERKPGLLETITVQGDFTPVGDRLMISGVLTHGLGNELTPAREIELALSTGWASIIE